MIELIPSDDLIEELMSRYDDVIFCGRQIKDTQDNTHRVRQYKGDFEVCIGLAEEVKHQIIAEVWKND